MGKLKNVIYVSSAVRKYSKDELHEYLIKFRDNNKKNGISGVLIYQEGTFLQFIEGPIAAVDSLIEKIAADQDHKGITTLREQEADVRLFSDWSMGFKEMSGIEDLPDYYDFVNRTLEGADESEFAYRFIRSFAHNYYRK